MTPAESSRLETDILTLDASIAMLNTKFAQLDEQRATIRIDIAKLRQQRDAQVEKLQNAQRGIPEPRTNGKRPKPMAEQPG